MKTKKSARLTTMAVGIIHTGFFGAMGRMDDLLTIYGSVVENTKTIGLR